MPRSKTAVFGIYSDFSTLRHGVDCLKAIGLSSDEISVLFRESAVSRTLAAHERAENHASLPGDPEPLIGGTLGALRYIRTDSVGIVSAALESIGVPRFNAQRHEHRLRSGGLLISVRCPSIEQRDSISEILARTGALDIASSCAPHAAPPIPAWCPEKAQRNRSAQLTAASGGSACSHLIVPAGRQRLRP
jgi:hypothetical protein